jgi:hypothetical protein
MLSEKASDAAEKGSGLERFINRYETRLDKKEFIVQLAIAIIGSSSLVITRAKKLIASSYGMEQRVVDPSIPTLLGRQEEKSHRYTFLSFIRRNE